jgi:hypothetical protein
MFHRKSRRVIRTTVEQLVSLLLNGEQYKMLRDAVWGTSLPWEQKQISTCIGLVPLCATTVQSRFGTNRTLAFIVLNWKISLHLSSLTASVLRSFQNDPPQHYQKAWPSRFSPIMHQAMKLWKYISAFIHSLTTTLAIIVKSQHEF